MIRKLLKILHYTKIKGLFKTRQSNSTYTSLKNDNDNYIQEMIDKGFISKSIAEKYLKNNEDVETSMLIQNKIEKRIQERDKITNKRYAKIIKNVIAEKNL